MDLPAASMLAEQYRLLDEKRAPALPIGLMLFGATAAAATYFSAQADYATASAVALLGMGLRSGYRAGAATFLGLFAGGAVAILAAVPIARVVEPLVAQTWGVEGLAKRLLSIGAVGLSLILIVTLLVRFTLRRMVRNQPRWTTCDRWMGLACGGLQAGLLVLITASAALVIEPLARDELLIRRPEDRSIARRVSEQVVVAAKMTRAGTLGPLVASYNPFEHLGVLKSLPHSVEVLRSPEVLRAVANHPAVEELYEQPAFQRAREQLLADPELQAVVSSGEPLTRDALASLMQNPTVLRMCDDPEFIAELTSALGKIDPQSLLSSTGGNP